MTRYGALPICYPHAARISLGLRQERHFERIPARAGKNSHLRSTRSAARERESRGWAHHLAAGAKLRPLTGVHLVGVAECGCVLSQLRSVRKRGGERGRAGAVRGQSSLGSGARSSRAGVVAACGRSTPASAAQRACVLAPCRSGARRVRFALARCAHFQLRRGAIFRTLPTWAESSPSPCSSLPPRPQEHNTSAAWRSTMLTCSSVQGRSALLVM